MCGHTYAMVLVWRSEDNLQELVLSLFLHVCSFFSFLPIFIFTVFGFYFYMSKMFFNNRGKSHLEPLLELSTERLCEDYALLVISKNHCLDPLLGAYVFPG